MTESMVFLTTVFLMMINKEKIESYSFVLEPSYEKDSSVHSWEILTRKVTKRNINNENDFYFSSLNEKEIIDVFNKQLLTIAKIDSSYLKGEPVSLNVDSTISEHILSDRYISDYIKAQKNITIEISENFHEFKKMSCMTELELLSKLCPVWLDDFGRGLTNFKVIELFKFQCIKIDKEYFWENQYRDDFTETLREIQSYCNFVIVEGVETAEQKNKVFSVINSACQGQLWKENYYYIEC